MIAIALLRGINVGGRHLVPMAALRQLLESLGLRNVRTLLQSGNVVFECATVKGLQRTMEAALEERFGFRPAVILRTADQMKDVVSRSPFAGREDVAGNRLLVTFLAGVPKTFSLEGLAEEVHVLGEEMFVYFPDGVGQSRFPFAAVEKKLGVTGTARNWNTILKLVELSDSLK